MAPIKRLRPIADEEDDSEDDRSSVETHASRKRARLSNEGHIVSVTGSETADELSDTDSSEDNDDLDIINANQDEQDTIRATQIILKSTQSNSINNPAEYGIIESVTCINFMLHVVFGPSVNFVIGMNGSGKSAVLTALTLCLGGKPSSTNRGSSLKDFIKEGEESSTVVVKLKNQGYGFQQEQYGESITVERLFSRSGASGFKLKSANGRIVSTKRSDLEEVCDFFALQIDNPLNVLTQDMARQFLNESTPAEKYKFFLKGVQLEQLDHDYKLLQEITDSTLDTLGENKAEVVRLERLAQDAKDKMLRQEKNNEMRAKLALYRKQYIWSQVIDEEEKMRVMEETLANVEQSLQKARQNVEIQKEKEAEYRNDISQAENSFKSLQEEQTSIDEKKSLRRAAVETADRELKAVLSQQRDIASQLKALNLTIKQADAEIAEEDRRMAEADGGSYARKLEEIDRAKKALDDLISEAKDHKAELPDLKKKAETADEKLKKSDELKRTKENEIRSVEDRILQLDRERGTAKENNFARRLSELVHRNEHKFQEKPVGPMGQYVTLRKPKWSSILERTLGGTLNGFVVTSKRDQSILQALFVSNGFDKVPIFIGNNRPLDLTGKEPDPEFDTALRVLEFDSELVRKQFIINHFMDQTLLIESRQEGNRVMYHNGRPPRNVRCCLSMHDNRAGWGLRLATRNGETTTSPIQPWTEATRMKTDAQAQLRLQKELLARLRQDLSTLESNSRNLQRDLQICQREEREHDTKAKRHQSNITKARQQIDDLEQQAEQAVPDRNRRGGWEDSKKKAEEEKVIAEGSYQDAVTARDKFSAAKKDREAELREVDIEGRDHIAKMHKENIRLDKIRSLIAQSQKQQTALMIEQEKWDEQRQDILQNVGVQKGRVGKWREDATKISDRIHRDPDDTTTSLERKMEKISADLNRVDEELGGTREELIMAAESALSKFTSADGNLKKISEVHRMLLQTLNGRKERWLAFRQHISARARARFGLFLSERNFRGALITDHQNHVLELKVEPDKTRTTAKGRQTQTLSGGEKSFSTICLLLALWDAMGSPIRCLDEFDVFMDNVNRDVTMSMIMQVSRRTMSRQYVLISPQAMGNMKVTDNCKVILLSKEDQNQRRLGINDGNLAIER